MAIKSGLKEAAKMLQSLGGQKARDLLGAIAKKDPKMAELLEKNLVSMNDIQYLSPSMLVGLLRDVDLKVFGLALRGIDRSIIDKILGMVSTGIKLDIEDGLKGPPRKISEVEDAQNKVLAILKDKIDKGHIVINPQGDTLV